MMYLLIFGLFLGAFTGAKASNSFIHDKAKVSEIAMMGAHNITMNASDGWYYAQQSVPIEDLLEKHFVRYMKTPVHWYKKKKNQEPYLALCHESSGSNNCKATIVQRGGKSPQTLESFLEKVQKFAKKNPKEVILVKLESQIHKLSDKNGMKGVDLDDAVKKLDQSIESVKGLAQRVKKLNDWPTLGALRSSGKNIILLGQHDETAKKSRYLSQFSTLMNQTHWQDKKQEDCQLYKSKSDSGFYEINVNPEMSITKDGVVGKGLSALNKVTKAVGAGPLRVGGATIESRHYSDVNSAENAKKRLELCREKHEGKIQGFVLSTDHVHEGDAIKVVDEHNKRVNESFSR